MTLPQKIENPRTELSKKKSANDEDILGAMASTEKSLSETYVNTMQNASYEKLYSLLFTMFKESSQQYRKLFELQFQHGWRSFTSVSATEIKATQNQFEKLGQQLN
ncbi:spore coat protein [Sporosarcina sp. CAU 1771]